MATEKAPETVVQEPIIVVYDDGVETLTPRVAVLCNAQRLFSIYSQEQMDQIFLAAVIATNHQQTPLAKLIAVETDVGIAEDKVIRNHYASEYIHNAYKNTRTCNVLEQDISFDVQTIVEPIGVIAAVVPTTNPTSVAIFKILLCLKTRSATLVCPHPRVKESTITAAWVVLNIAMAAGAPKGIIARIDAPSVELTNQATKEADLILAIGDPDMVQTAYSSGEPTIGVGAGSTPATIDDSTDLILTVSSITHSKTSDNGTICASEQSMIVLDGVYEQIKVEFVACGRYLLNPDETEKIRRTILIDGMLNSKIAGQSAYATAKLPDFDVPENAKTLIGEVESIEPQEAFAYKKLNPVLAMYRAKDFIDTIQKAKRLVADDGYGHTSPLHINTVTKPEKFRLLTAAMKICRVPINTPATQGDIGDLYNFKLPSPLTPGYGSWGENSVSENVGVKHLLNTKIAAKRRENMLRFRTPERVYSKWGCLPVALGELRDVLDKKRVFLVVDEFLFRSRYTKGITNCLSELGIAHTTFFDIQPGPVLYCVREGVAAMKAFAPDCIIALGSGSAMDTARIMWTMYEHPEVDSMDLVMCFMDIRKRVHAFPKMGEKTYFITIPTSTGTGSEVTPLAVITGEATGIKYPLTDYELIPRMTIVDVDLIMHMPKGLTAASGIDAITRALEVYAAMLATDYTDDLILKALKNIFIYLLRACEYGTAGPITREKMANASAMADTAFANAFPGVCHSMAHKLRTFHHLSHGVANALMITYTMCFSADLRSVKMETSPQYQYSHTLEHYRECADLLDIPGKDEEEKFNGLIAAVGELKTKIGVPRPIQAWGVNEVAFLATLDEMTEHAFDDQCIGANPRYPLMSEIRQMCLDVHHGG